MRQSKPHVAASYFIPADGLFKWSRQDKLEVYPAPNTTSGKVVDPAFQVAPILLASLVAAVFAMTAVARSPRQFRSPEPLALNIPVGEAFEKLKSILTTDRSLLQNWTIKEAVPHAYIVADMDYCEQPLENEAIKCSAQFHFDLGKVGEDRTRLMWSCKFNHWCDRQTAERMEKFTADWIRLKMFPKEPPPIPLPIEISTLLTAAESGCKSETRQAPPVKERLTLDEQSRTPASPLLLSESEKRLLTKRLAQTDEGGSAEKAADDNQLQREASAASNGDELHEEASTSNVMRVGELQSKLPLRDAYARLQRKLLSGDSIYCRWIIKEKALGKHLIAEMRYTNGSVTYGTLIKFEFASTSSRATRVTWSYHPFAEPSNQEEVTSIQEMTDDWIKCILWTPGAR